MINLNYAMRLVVAITLTGTLSGCGDEQSRAQASSDVQQHVKPVVRASDQSPGKPSIPVNIDFEFLSTPAVNQPMRVRLVIDSREAYGLSMQMSTRGALAMAKNMPTSIALKATTAAGGANNHSHEAIIIPSAEGRSFLNLQVSGMYDNAPFTKAIAIPIQVGQGGVVLEQNGEIIDTGVEVLSSMPASQSKE